MADSNVNAMGLARGRKGTEAEMRTVDGQVRRMLSTVSGRAQAQCPLTIMSNVGEGVGQAAKRRHYLGCSTGGEYAEGKTGRVDRKGPGEEHG